ncbi:PREDICTED: golgin subfamily A member 6-like protein 22, partial [Vollenhovia emeryi]|uniref:golgin subfamily A member 6-like protein 22 n=1 Tax=Vollenhovia emeryi TaxID=411798 RepID=UPI0005F51D2A
MKKWMEEKEEMKKHIERLEKKMEEMQARKQGTNENGGEANEEVKRLAGKMRGLSNKDREFWRDLEKWDAIVMMETWVEEKGWGKVRDRLPEGFIWRMQAAVKKNKKGRAAGGMMIGIRKEVTITDTEREEESEGVMIGKVKLDKKIIRVVGAYVNGDMERKLSILEGWMEQKEEGVKTIIGGDFNARTGEEGEKESIEGTDEWTFKRCSKDKKINKEGKKLIQSIKERGWYILNGGERGDLEGNWTYSGGRGESVIDYVIVEQETEEEIERMEIVDKIDSDHQPIVVWLKGHKNKEARRKRTEREGGRGVWDEEGREAFRDKLGEIKTGEGRLDEEIDGMEGRIREAMEKVEGERETGRRKRRGWWDEECKEVKGTARKVLKEWLRGKGERQKYRRKRKEYKELCERKKEEENKKLEKEAEKVHTEEMVWRVVNKERKKRKKINTEIEMKQWEEYFKALLGGVENKVAAYDSVDRGILIEAMRKKGIREGIIERVEEIMRETTSRVRVRGEIGKEFWTARGLRQGCPLSADLFNILLADLEEEMGKVKWGGIRLGEEKIYSITYADDVVVIAEDEGCMIERLERYMDSKRLELNVTKTKIVRFKEGGGRLSTVDWRWKGKKIEEVKEVKYLGYVLQRNGGQEAHIRERVAKAAAVSGQVWGIGKRRFARKWERRIALFDKLVWTVASYGAEIWGWRTRKKMESLHERHLKWILGIDRLTPGYMIREEIQREMMKSRAGKRAWKFEERLLEGRGSILAQKCLWEIRESAKGGREMSSWEIERKLFLEEKGLDSKELEEEREERRIEYEEIERRDKEMQREERWKKIRESKSNR